MKRAYTKQHRNELHKLLPKVKCNICSVTKEESKKYNRDLVWDHNHTTNIIRGVLCSLCNSWLVFYERQQLCNFEYPEKVFGNTVALWMLTFKVNIEKHLQTNTGIVYSDKPSFIEQCR